MKKRQHHPDAIRKIDIASAMLIIVGIVCGSYSLNLIIENGHSWSIIIPSLSVLILGVKNMFIYEAPRVIFPEDN